MDRPLKIISWNANGVRAKKNELHLFATEVNADIILINETHLQPDVVFNIPAYVTLRTDRLGGVNRRPMGGTAVLVHRRITYRPVQLHAAPLEATGVCIQTNDVELTLVACYVPPSAPLPADQISAILDRRGPVLIAGDLNAKHPAWNSRITNARGRQLHRLAARHGANIIAPATPTYYSSNHLHRPDVLDIAILKDLPFQLEVRAVDDLSSDHLPLLITANASPVSRDPQMGHAVRTDWGRFHDILLDHLHPQPPAPVTPAELDAMVIKLQVTLQDAIAHASSPALERRHIPVLPDHIQEEVRTRRRLRRDWQRSRDPVAKRRFQAQCARVKGLLDEHRTDSWNTYLEGLDIVDGSAWKVAKLLRGTKISSCPLHGRRGLVYSAGDKAEAFADTMEAQFEPHYDVIDDDHEDMVEEYTEAYFEEDPDDVIEPFSPEEILVEVLGTKVRKAAGLDKIGARALQSCPPSLIDHLEVIYNTALRLRHFPTPWKEAKIILIPKPRKDHLFPQNYRPISLLPVASKIFERLLLRRLSPLLDDVIRPEQFGFRKGHSTTLQLVRVVNKLVDARNMNLATVAVLLDVSKAFDKVWHEGLLYKLAGTPLPSAAVHLLRSYLSGRTFKTTVDGHLSTARPVLAGVPQGSVLGPVLYLVFTNDIPTIPRVTLSLYADDAMFHCSSARPAMAATRMQHQLDVLSPWLKKWKVKVNAEKSEAIVFKKYRRMPRAPLPPLTLDGDAVGWKGSVKYLGVTLDDKLNFRKHANAKLDEATRLQGFLNPLLNRGSPLPVKVKVTIFLMIVRAVLMYASTSWWALLCKTMRQKVEACQSKAIRRIMGAPWFVANDVIRSSLGVPTLDIFATSTAANLFRKAEESGMDHFADLARREGAPEFRLPRPRAILDDPP